MFLQELRLTEMHGIFSRCPHHYVIHLISLNIEDAVLAVIKQLHTFIHKDNSTSTVNLAMNTYADTLKSILKNYFNQCSCIKTVSSEALISNFSSFKDRWS
ncbi:hypothetical protein CDAR_416131 [Caerostris darwini]|uniref:Uncharacterized protein n=1 Tax=Caerostris darwini TaxID=1538125 RepID=A0AAV4RRD1_9ARAC|nr:hypothetical protein CDAR_416131 [Caerostris darwini]